ncbi:hypothetical protein ZIOFF_009232 [Zingiber officinale]|uniref:Uncharacterized protein n=1 Tax=Zingiber officinale TaxID=94328 RepID=A0A8J5HFA8_ZINOF|nr:hypothetical protein ZIOFF_009232 [Zingiber officinale]
MAALTTHKPPPSPDSGDSKLNLSTVAVTTCLYLKAVAGEKRSLDREAVLRRIRRRKHVYWLRNALQTLLKPAAPPSSAGREAKGNAVEGAPCYSWLDASFAFP